MSNRRRVYAAYRVAWQQGKSSGLSDPRVLEESFKQAGVSSEHLDRRCPEGQFWFGAWKEGVVPRRLRWHLFAMAAEPYLEAFQILRDGLRSSTKVPRSRRIPSDFETLSFDGWVNGNVVKVVVKSFEPSDNAASLLLPFLRKTDEKIYREFPVWLGRIEEDFVEVMSGKDVLGRITADVQYAPILRKIREKNPDMVADGTILARRNGDGVKFKKLRVHVIKAAT